MNETSSMSDLQRRLQKRAEQDRQQIEAVIQSELKKLSENLNRIVENELYIIGRDTKVLRKRLSMAVLKAWTGPIGVGLLIFLGIFVGSWGLTQLLSSSVESHIEARAAIRLEIEQEQRTLDQLRAQTWGVWLHEAEDGGRHVVLPQGTFEDWPWTVQGQPAIRLYSE